MRFFAKGSCPIAPSIGLSACGLCACLWIAGCSSTTQENIETWKGTQKGPQKLREVVESSADPRLRALAVAALVEIGLASDAAQVMTKMAPPARALLTHELVSPLAALLGESAAKAVPTTPAQRAAKDALFVSRADASPEDRKHIDALLVTWTTSGLAARASQGGESTDKILRAIGPAAVPALVPLVRPGPDMASAARLVGELGDRQQKKKAAAPLVTLIKNGPGGLEKVSEPYLQALGLVGGDEATTYLLEIANKGSKQAREKALYALAQGTLSSGDARALDGTAAIVADSHAPGEVREAAFQVLEKLGPPAVSTIIRAFGDKDTTVRFRAVEAAIKAGGIAAVGPVLGKLPTDRSMKSQDLDDLVVHDLAQLGHDAIPQLALEAHGRSGCLGQIAAIRAIGLVGKANDATALDDLLSVSESCRLLTPPTSVGDEAKRGKTAALLRH